MLAISSTICIIILNILTSQLHAQLHVEKETPDGIKTFVPDPNAGNDEIFTSMHDIEKFFFREQYFIKELKAILAKKLIGPEAKPNILMYVDSYADVVGNQEESVSFLHNPLNVYNLIRHAALGWHAVDLTVREEERVKKSRRGQLPWQRWWCDESAHACGTSIAEPTL